MTRKGLSKPQLDRMHKVLLGHIQRREIAGMVALASRHDDAIHGCRTLAYVAAE